MFRSIHEKQNVGKDTVPLEARRGTPTGNVFREGTLELFEIRAGRGSKNPCSVRSPVSFCLGARSGCYGGYCVLSLGDSCPTIHRGEDFSDHFYYLR